ncbi:type IV-A pilus assembly ATPase PilB [Natroniella sulfidigena]|uniref:type IV-A pilus assembly ATPase PilB n=1 Tax=Natroniella sulfidigena TaxID=723921 RepID=UPI00200AD0DB|nr:type IV-A pilus assembly ATPase PilB [Natroniella sulfidigena]MCK8816857.1 type IV-A pilus assembly ATPase PilB [Natroniella sulfidigena]
MIKKKRLGDILVEVGFITQEELQQALQEQKGSDKRLGQVMKEMGLITDQDVMEALEFQLGIPQVNLRKFVIDPEVVKMIPQALAEKHRLIPMKRKGNTLTIAMADPLDVMAIDDISVHTGCEITPVIASPEEIEYAINQYYGNEDVVNEFVEDISSRVQREEDGELGLNRLRQMVEEAPVVKLVNNIIEEGIQLKASDIHIEPQEEIVRVRYRVDGVLYNEMNVPRHTHSALISRIKIMAGLDIAKRRVPQDGRVELDLENREVDLRVSILPTIKGEKVVIRILDKSSLMLDLKQLGFLPGQERLFKRLINQPYGMILITGPTGSGKTTTLYSALKSLNSSEQNIITVEDPVEYRLDGVNQVQTNPKAGLDFANGLRSILRQDPDIIMVGEIRDKETAEIAIHAALTGHLVLSTLHTNQASGALARLVNMGVEPFLVASSVLGVVAQRLLRTLCDDCKTTKELPEDFDQKLDSFKGKLEQNADEGSGLERFGPQGCRVCNQTGYRGRTAIHELLEVDGELEKLVMRNASASEIEDLAKEKGLITLEGSGLMKVEQGVTSLEEVMRVTKVQVEEGE